MHRNMPKSLLRISIIGTGHVGLVTGACFAKLGFRVICVDSNREKIDCLRKGRVPFYEPGLKELVAAEHDRKRLFFSYDITSAIQATNIVFICVGTPPKPNGEADLDAVQKVASQIAQGVDSYKLIVEKSTVPVCTGEIVRGIVGAYVDEKLFDVASNPEFLREGSAIRDFLHPDRIVIGVESEKAEQLLRKAYAKIRAPLVVTNVKTAEIIKHVSNSFLATKVSFINAVARVSDGLGTDIKKIVEGVGLDKRIGREFFNAGIGFGGSCFPKDLDAFYHIARMAHYDFALLKEVNAINATQREYFLYKVKGFLSTFRHKKIAVLGLSFKEGTDDIRQAPSLALIERLLAEQAQVRVYDPAALEGVRARFGADIAYEKDMYFALTDAECVMIVTDWEKFARLDLARVKKLMKKPFLIADGRNVLDPERVRNYGLKYIGIGRG